MILSRVVVSLSGVAATTSALAQTTGTLTYGAAAVAPIPVPIHSLILLPLSIAIACLGYRALRTPGGRQLLGAVVLALGLGLGGLSGLHIQQAIAAATIALDNPAGGSVVIPRSDATFANTSGVPLQIGAVTPPPACATIAPAAECVTAMELADGESCSTAYDCAQIVSDVSSPTVSEGDDLIFSVVLTDPAAAATSHLYSLGGGSASASDFGTPGFSDGVTLAGGSVIVPSGVSSFTVTVPTVDDPIFESTETLLLSVGGITGTGTITDNEVPPRILSIGVFHATEGADLVCTVTLEQASLAPFTFAYSIGGGTASAADYGAPAFDAGVTADGSNLLIPAGVTSFRITLPTVDDSLNEGTERVPFTVNSLTINGIIYDNDPVPSISIDSTSVNEAAGMTTFSVTLSAASGRAISVDYDSSDGTAMAGSDYTAVSGSVSFAAGEASKNITVNVIDDDLNEESENFTVSLSNPANATLGTAIGTGVIVDNDGPP